MNELFAQRQDNPLALQSREHSYPDSGAVHCGSYPFVKSATDTLVFLHAGMNEQADQLLTIQETERQRIAIDLHDGIGPLLTLIKLELTNAAGLLGGGRRQAGVVLAAIQRAEDNVSRAFDELRRTVMDLRPSMLDDLGILPTLGWLVREFELSGTGVAIERQLLADERDIPAALKIVIFRVCQEALNNVIKHAHARRVKLAMDMRDGLLHLSIEDDGRGFSTASQDIFNRAGGGLAGIMRRAGSSGGSCDVQSCLDSGTRIAISWPLPARRDGRAPALGGARPF